MFICYIKFTLILTLTLTLVSGIHTYIHTQTHVRLKYRQTKAMHNMAFNWEDCTTMLTSTRKYVVPVAQKN